MSAIPEQTSSTQPLHVAWNGPKVALSPEEQDRFIKEVHRAFFTSQNELAIERFLRQFTEEFLPSIQGWCKAHDDRVEACYVAFAKDHVRVFMVRRSDP